MEVAGENIIGEVVDVPCAVEDITHNTVFPEYAFSFLEHDMEESVEKLLLFGFGYLRKRILSVRSGIVLPEGKG